MSRTRLRPLESFFSILALQAGRSGVLRGFLLPEEQLDMNTVFVHVQLPRHAPSRTSVR